MKTSLSKSENKGVFSVEENGVEAGTMSFFMDDKGKMAIDHTVVNPDFRGKGIGKVLVEEGVNYARNHSLKINPICTYAKALLEKTDAYSDVL